MIVHQFRRDFGEVGSGRTVPPILADPAYSWLLRVFRLPSGSEHVVNLAVPDRLTYFTAVVLPAAGRPILLDCGNTPQLHERLWYVRLTPRGV